MRDDRPKNPLQRDTTAGIIADHLRAQIVRGEFSSGAQLGEAQIAHDLAVSRGPVREAIQRLVQEGLLENRRHKGVFVVEFGCEDVEDIYIARATIERAALRIVAETGDAETLDLLEGIINRMGEAAERKNWTRAADLDMSFHESLVEASGSKRLNRMFSTLISETRMCMASLAWSYEDHKGFVREHRELLKAIKDGDWRQAHKLLEANFSGAVAQLQEAIENGSASSRSAAGEPA